MLLKDLLTTVGISIQLDHPALNLEVTGLTTNSHTAKPGDLFIGMPGTRVDGGDFWESAIVSGAIAALVSEPAATKIPATNQLLIAVKNPAEVCAHLAVSFYNNPTNHLKMVGVTGTNGKTTTTHIIEFLLDHGGKMPMMLGTLYTRWKGFNQTATHTTPFPIDLQKQLNSLDARNRIRHRKGKTYLPRETSRVAILV